MQSEQWSRPWFVLSELVSEVRGFFENDHRNSIRAFKASGTTIKRKLYATDKKERYFKFGSRALGNRSIIADARSEEMQVKLNLKIKYRESFRPFAPSVLYEDVSGCFEIPGKRYSWNSGKGILYWMKWSGLCRWRLLRTWHRWTTGLKRSSALGRSYWRLFTIFRNKVYLGNFFFVRKH